MANGSSGKLADTTFNTSPDDKLAVVDVYESGGGGVENSYQEKYSQNNDNGVADSFKDIGKKNSPPGGGSNPLGGGGGNPLGGLNPFGGGNPLGGLGGSNPLGGLGGGGGNPLNSILNGLKSGNLGSLTSLAGGAFTGLKQISDIVNTVNTAVNAVKTIGNTLKGGLNANALINRVANNLPLAQQIKGTIRNVGTIKSSSPSLESSMGRASNLLGGDRSSQNTILNGTVNKSRTIETPRPYDKPVSEAETTALVDKLKSISPQVSSAISDLPVNTQAALVRGFNNEDSNKGLLAASSTGVTRMNPEASKDVIEPIQKIIGNFSPNSTPKVKVQDTNAVATLLSGVSNIANKAGFKDTFSKITKKITNKDVILKAAKPLVTRAVDEGDIDMIVDLSKSSVYKELKNVTPDLVKKTCYQALRPEGLGQQGFSEYYRSMKTAFDRIDPKWNSYKPVGAAILIDGSCISSNAFICDLIEATLNERKNTKLTGSNGQNVKKENGSLIDTDEPVQENIFTKGMQDAVEALNKEAYKKFREDISNTVTLPPETTQPPVEAVEPPPVLNYDNEKFLLLASVFVDNSIPSEIEKHFPFLHVRFQAMGTYTR